ncbi:MAG: TonB-dependent receptor [Saprospiraceae bacterium]
MNLKTLLFCITFIAQVSIPLLGQSTGSIKINVSDKESGEPLIGASVSVVGTSKGNVTDLDGVAMISNLPVGAHSIRVSYVSYQAITVNDVLVEEQNTVQLNVPLQSDNVQMTEIVIAAKAMKNSENALLTLQKKSPKLFDAITADQFSKIGVSDAAGALKKVTGVTIEGGKYVYVRGLGDRYSKANLNSSEVPSLDPNKNSLQLDLFPSNLIDNIIVYKTFTPDLQGDFAGGLVDISTKDFPDDFNMQVSLGLGYNSQANFNKNFLDAQGSKTDFLGYDNGFRALPSEIAAYKTPSDFPDPYLNKDAITQVSRAFDNTQFNPTQQSQFLNHKMSLSVGDQVNLFSKPLGYIFGFSYNKSFSGYTGGTQNVFDGISQGQQTLDNDILTTTVEDKSATDVLMGAMFNTSYKIDNRNKVGLSLLTNQSGTEESRYQVGYILDTSPDSSTLIQNRAINYQQRSFHNGQLRGEHLIPGLNDLSIKWSNSFTRSSIEQPDFRLMRNQFRINTAGDSLFFVNNLDRPSRFFRDLQEMNENAKLDFSLPVSVFGKKGGKLKFGGLYTYKKRMFTESLYEYNIQTALSFDGNIQGFFDDENLGYVNNELRNYLQINDTKNSYDAKQNLWASYLMIETPIFTRMNLSTGVRFEKTDITLDAADNVTGEINTNDFLPALALTYNITDRSNLRFSASRTLARPSFREFAPFDSYDFLGGYIQNGNPELKRTLINNLDLRWEKYPAAGEYLAFSLFYKKFIDPIENAQIPSAGGSTSQFQFKNVPESNLFGAELELRKSLGDWIPALKDFKASTNFSYVYTYVKITPEELLAIQAWNNNPGDTRPMYNQAPYSFNGNLSYENQNRTWESTVSFNVTGERLIVYQIDLPSIYLQPMPELNFTLKRNINNRASIRFSAANLLNSSYKEQIDLADKVYYTTRYQSGRAFSLSFNYKIN